jgi:hypothetical protein
VSYCLSFARYVSQLCTAFSHHTSFLAVSILHESHRKHFVFLEAVVVSDSRTQYDTQDSRVAGWDQNSIYGTSVTRGMWEAQQAAILSEEAGTKVYWNLFNDL